MNPRTKRKMDKINQILADNQQTTRITYLSTTELHLHTGVILKDVDAYRFTRRVMNKKVIDWVKNTDKLLSGEVTESQIKNISFSIGGKACQKKHGEEIKKNLNTGTPWNKGKKGVQIGWSKGLTKETDPRILKFAKFGEKNGMFGIKMSDEQKTILSKRMQESILNGKFTPKSNNRNTHWGAFYLGKAFRSSWEAWYQSLFPLAEYETLRIPYKINDVVKVYIVDFINHNDRTIAEVKPRELTTDPVFVCKWDALVTWATENGYIPILATKQWLISNTQQINYSLFDDKTSEKIKKIYETSKKN